MKLIHLSDLHLGKRVNEFSMLEDQKYILEQIVQAVEREEPDGVLIAGDVYDKPAPPVEAVKLLDDFLVQLVERGSKVFAISGNHDSPERIAFGSRLMRGSGVYFSQVYEGTAASIEMRDEFGVVRLHLLPFLKPAYVRRYHPERGIESDTDAVGTVVEGMEIDPSVRNVLVAHQFVTGAVRCDSEEVSVGGADNVNAEVFEPFDYVALGHIHSPQNVGKNTIRYCGTPLKYSFSETKHEKSLSVVELREKGNVGIRTIPLTPRRELRELRGSYMEVTARDFYRGMKLDDYYHITLTDEEDIPDAVGKLRAIYPNIMKLDYDNKRTQMNGRLKEIEEIVRRSPLELFGEFYEAQNNQQMSETQRAFVETLMEEIWGGRA